MISKFLFFPLIFLFTLSENSFDFEPADSVVFNSSFGESEFKSYTNSDTLFFHNESDDFLYQQKFLIKDDGFYLIETNQELDVFLFVSSNKNIKYSSGVKRYPKTLELGLKWSWEGYELIDEDSNFIKIESEISKYDTVFINNKKYTCFVISTKVFDEEGIKNEVNEWISEKEGLVKLWANVRKQGIVGLFQDIFGLDIIEFELKEFN